MGHIVRYFHIRFLQKYSLLPLIVVVTLCFMGVKSLCYVMGSFVDIVGCWLCQHYLTFWLCQMLSKTKLEKWERANRLRGNVPCDKAKEFIFIFGLV